MQDIKLFRIERGDEITTKLDNLPTDTNSELSEINLDITNLENSKVDKIIGKGLSTEDYSTAEKAKLSSIESGAEVNNISDIDSTDLTDGGETTLHIHDGRYYTETEVNSLLSGKEDTIGYSPLQNVVAGTNVTIDNTDPLNPVINASGGSGSGDVIGPATNTDSYIPQWDGANSKTLKNGIPTSTFAPALGIDDNYVTDAEKTILSNTSNTNSGDQLVFKNIAVSGQDTIVADTITDTLNIASGDNHLTISTNASTDTITITAIPTVCFFPTGIEFGSATQQYDVSGSTFVSAVAGGTLGGIPNATTGHTLTDCIEAVTISRDGKYLNVKELTGAPTPTNPLTVQFLFSGITDFNVINLRSYYTGSVSHNINIQLWNYTTSAWDTYTSFAGETGYVARTIEVFNGDLYLSGGVAKLQFIHTTSGLGTHQIEFDYVSLCSGGGGSGGASIASAVAYTPTGNISAINVQTAINELDTEKAPLASPTFTGTVVLGTSPTMTTPVITGLPTGTGVSATSTASTLVARNSSKNIYANNIIGDYTTTATAGGTTALTVASTFMQYFTGTTTQIVTMPNSSTLVVGQSFEITNLSTGNVTLNSFGTNQIVILSQNQTALITCISVAVNTARAWDYNVLTKTPSSGGSNPIYETQIAGEQTVGLIARFTAKGTQTIAGVKISLATLPTGANFIVDVRKNGTASTNSIFTSDAGITITTSTGATNGIYTVTNTTIDNGSLVADDILYFYITQIGSTLSGTSLGVVIY